MKNISKYNAIRFFLALTIILVIALVVIHIIRQEPYRNYNTTITALIVCLLFFIQLQKEKKIKDELDEIKRKEKEKDLNSRF